MPSKLEDLLCNGAMLNCCKIIKGYPPASEASRGVYWNQAQTNFTHPYTTLTFSSELREHGRSLMQSKNSSLRVRTFWDMNAAFYLLLWALFKVLKRGKRKKWVEHSDLGGNTVLDTTPCCIHLITSFGIDLKILKG